MRQVGIVQMAYSWSLMYIGASLYGYSGSFSKSGVERTWRQKYSLWMTRSDLEMMLYNLARKKQGKSGVPIPNLKITQANNNCFYEFSHVHLCIGTMYTMVVLRLF